VPGVRNNVTVSDVLFFKRILKESAPAAPVAAPVERRSVKRFAIHPQFPLQAVLSYIGRDENGEARRASRPGWTWKGRMLDCSTLGARIQMGPVPKVSARDLCDLMLTLEDFELTIPCHITHVRDQPGGMVFGLRYDIENAATRHAYGQLLEVLALGSTLRPQTKPPFADASGYVVERYASDRPAALTIWRHPADQSVAAFAFQLKDSLVRGATGHEVEFLSGTVNDAHPVPAAKALEIRRLFCWVVPNLAPTVPEDVREFLRRCAD
jgi:hypothetical protein